MLYQEKDTCITLSEGLKEYYKVNPGFAGTGEFLGQSRKTVIAHDVCHVVFGLGTTSKEELMIEVITLFGCELPIQKVKEMKKVKFFGELWKIFGPWRLAKRFVLTTPTMLRTFLMTQRMKKKWPHFDYEKYINIPLQDIRNEFGIQVLKIQTP